MNRDTQPAAASSQRWARIAAHIGILVVGFVAWQMVAGSLVPTFYLPKPTQVLMELASWIKDGSLLTNIIATLVPAAEGLVIASVSALILGYAMGTAGFAADVLEPYVTAVYGVPIIALVPLMILWFGIGQGLAAVAVATMTSFFLMFYNVYFGIRDVSQTLIDQVLIAGGSRWDIATRVRLPSALVWFVAGTKVAVPHALVGVVVAEFLTGNRGLGFLLSSNASQFDAAGTFAAVTVLAAIVFVVDRTMFALTRKALMWREPHRAD